MTVCDLDEEAARVEMLQDALGCLGYHSVGTSDSEYALTWIDPERVRVLLSGIKMPGMDGLHVLAQAILRDQAMCSES
jgi:DNA-binding NtrC family response regulator